MKINQIMENPSFKLLSPVAFKLYFVLLHKGGSAKTIKNFTILGQVKEWISDESINVLTSKTTLKKALKELIASDLIQLDQTKRELKIK